MREEVANKTAATSFDEVSFMAKRAAEESPGTKAARPLLYMKFGDMAWHALSPPFSSLGRVVSLRYRAVKMTVNCGTASNPVPVVLQTAKDPRGAWVISTT